MSLFTKILEKLGFKSVVAKPSSAPKPAPGPKSSGREIDRYLRKPAAIPVVDVVAKLEGMAAKNPQKLNWKRSIVDLLKLLDIDSSYEARKDLATELGCPPDLMNDSASMNTWLHKTVLQKIAQNGGNIPRNLLD